MIIPPISKGKVTYYSVPLFGHLALYIRYLSILPYVGKHIFFIAV